MTTRRSAPQPPLSPGAPPERLSKGAPGPVVADPRAALRTRLLAMREEIIATMLRDGFSPGLGALIVQIAATLDALDTPLRDDVVLQPFRGPQNAGSGESTPTTGARLPANRRPPPLPAIGARAVVADDNATIRLAVHAGAEPLASITLDPLHAVGLAGDLLQAAHRRMTR